jgi:hypothetical protein
MLRKLKTEEEANLETAVEPAVGEERKAKETY